MTTKRPINCKDEQHLVRVSQTMCVNAHCMLRRLAVPDWYMTQEPRQCAHEERTTNKGLDKRVLSNSTEWLGHYRRVLIAFVHQIHTWPHVGRVWPWYTAVLYRYELLCHGNTPLGRAVLCTPTTRHEVRQTMQR